MATYATVDQLRAYADIVGGVDADLEKVLGRAERDVDRLLRGGRGLGAGGLKLDPAVDFADPDEQWLADALANAACAQAEYRIAMGEDFFVRDQHQSASGPDFSTTGALARLGPKVLEELAGTGLVAATTSVSDPQAPWRSRRPTRL